MNISDQCRQAIIEYGILMNGDKPAGRNLMNLPVMRISIVQNEFPSELMTPYVENKLKQYGFTKPDVFPSGIEDSIKRAVGYWYNGKVEVVDLDENPDMRILAFHGSGTIGGFASFPIHDVFNIDDKKGNSDNGSKDPIIAIDMRSQRFAHKYSTRGYSLLERIEATIQHEFGHSFGILHTNRIFDGITPACKETEVKELTNVFSNSIMSPISVGQRSGSQVDHLFKNTISGEALKIK